MKTTLRLAALLLIATAFLVFASRTWSPTAAPQAERPSSPSSPSATVARAPLASADAAAAGHALSPWFHVPSSPARSAALIEILEALAARDPQHALQLASNEPEADTRSALWRAVLRGWATADPAAAARWALDNNVLTASEALAALAGGAAASPERALTWAADLIAERPQLRADVGLALVQALGTADEFPRAAAFASAAAADEQLQLLPAVFAAWARYEPEEALLRALAFPNATTRALAVRTAMSTWMQTDPVAFAQQAALLPPGEERDFALRLLQSATDE